MRQRRSMTGKQRQANDKQKNDRQAMTGKQRQAKQ
jgi:hypothetical protein